MRGRPFLTPDGASSFCSLFLQKESWQKEEGQKKREDNGKKALKNLCTFVFLFFDLQKKETRNPETTPVDGYLGSREDEERSETRYVMRIAGTSEPSNLRTHPALSAPPRARPSECRPQVPLIPFLSLFTERKEGGNSSGSSLLYLFVGQQRRPKYTLFRAKRSGILENLSPSFFTAKEKNVWEERNGPGSCGAEGGFFNLFQPRPRHQRSISFFHILFWWRKLKKRISTLSFFLDTKPFIKIISYIDRPRIGRRHPPDLSISLSGGKETNQDSLSSGERSGKSPSS
jgi:hypothetical protein